MNEEDFWIPQHLDAPSLFFIWEADVAIICILTIFIFALLQMATIGIFLSFFIVRGYSRLKDEGGRGLIVKVLYWYTPSELWFSKSLPSYQREFFGE